MDMTWFECSECNETFEVSNTIADAMHQWREASGDPYLCVACATQIEWGDAIAAMGEAENSTLVKDLETHSPSQ